MDITKELEIKETLCSVTSGTVEHTLQAIEEYVAAHITGDASVIAWTMGAIVPGRYSGGRISFREDILPETIEEIRVFNSVSEARLVQCGVGKLYARAIVEGKGNSIKYVDSISPLWGENRGSDGEYAVFNDAARKITIAVPYMGTADKVGLVTRSYIGSDQDTGLSGYTDSRFVSIEGMGV